MNYPRILLCVAVMALVTYLPRMLPLAIFKRKLKNRFLLSFLAYVPYAVLAAMTFPAILNSTASLASALVGLGVAVALSWRGCGLLPVALGSTAAVFLAERVLALL